MASKTINYPGIHKVPRFTTLIVSFLVTLGSGTNYVYSAYAPQLSSRLETSQTHSNIVGIAGHIGMYSSGLIWGRIVDAHGPRIPMISAFVLLLAGYSGMKLIFDAYAHANSTPDEPISFFTSCILVLCSFMTGAGGNAGLTSAVNATAKTFPDKARATTTGLVISGFSLSAFLFTTLSRILENTSALLRLLAFGTSILMIVGFVFLKPVQLPLDEVNNEHGHRRQNGGEQSPLLPLGTSPQGFVPRCLAINPHPNIHGYNLWKQTDFWLLFSILSILAGTSITYINNVGLMSHALYIYSLRDGREGLYDPITAVHWQADQVEAISLCNFAGQIAIGISTDTLSRTLSLRRSSFFVLVATLFLLSQIFVVLVVDDVRYLWITSAILGLAHGGVLALMSNVCLEWFGIAHFSENWGYLSIAPILFGNIFAAVFGRTVDEHSPFPSHEDPWRCVSGRQCYADGLYLPLCACVGGVLLSVWAGRRDRDWRSRRGG